MLGIMLRGYRAMDLDVEVSGSIDAFFLFYSIP